MKNLKNKISILLIVLSFISCDKEQINNTIENYIKVQEVEYKIETVQIWKEPSEINLNKIYLRVFDDSPKSFNIQYDNVKFNYYLEIDIYNVLKPNSSNTFYETFLLQRNGLIKHSNFTINEEYFNGKIWLRKDIPEGNTSFEDYVPIKVSNGNITLNQTAQFLEITIDIVTEDNKTLKGYYKGEANYGEETRI